MAAEVNGLEALTSDHPERACQYMVNRQKCIDGVLTAKALNLDVKAITDLPDDWRARLKKAQVVIRGDRATLSPGPRGKTVPFVRRDGHWLVEN